MDAARSCVDVPARTATPPLTAPVTARQRLRLHRTLLIKTLDRHDRRFSAVFCRATTPALVAAAGAAALLVTRRVQPAQGLPAIDWDLLMLFIGLFVVIGAR